MIRLKSLLQEGIELYKLPNGNWNYPKIESSTNALDIAALIKQSKGTFQDDEAVAEASFIAMTKSNLYNKVKTALGQDPYAYVKSFMSTNKTYHKQPIDISYKKIQTIPTASNSNLRPPAPLGTEIRPDFIQRIKNWENNKNFKPGGWNPNLKKWYPHRSKEGGTDTIGYGHKLTPDDVISGKFDRGITDDTANKLMLADLQIAKQKAMALIPSYASLPINTRQALINACYRGELSKSKTPNTLKLMRAGKWQAAAKEYLNHAEYRKGGGVKARMDWNAAQFRSTK